MMLQKVAKLGGFESCPQQQRSLSDFNSSCLLASPSL